MGQVCLPDPDWWHALHSYSVLSLRHGPLLSECTTSVEVSEFSGLPAPGVFPVRGLL